MKHPLTDLIGDEKVSSSWIDRLAFAHDASLYRLIPEAVVRPRDRNDIQQLLQWCASANRHLTFRAAGTSLSGQAVTSGILVDLSRNWREINIDSDGRYVSVQPGITGGMVNAKLRAYGRKIGPDPASLNACMIGGIVANNASGMCCGTAQNSYHTVSHMVFMLHNGYVVDTRDPESDRKLKINCPDIYDGVEKLHNTVLSSPVLLALIQRKYSIKNTIGYSLNAFLDETLPSRILMKLMIGSEGTLGFIERVVFETVVDARHKKTALFVYDTLLDACAMVSVFRDAGAAAIEIMDDASLASFADLPTTPPTYRIKRKGVAALLVEFHSEVPFIHDPHIAGDWTSNPSEQAVLWHLRKGLMPTVGAARPSGSTMINEDIAVPPQHLASLVIDVQALFVTYSYYDGLIFGHAKDGNIHFVVCQDFSKEGEIDRYKRFMEDIADIVTVKYNGSLKAEHGTGRNMAPFVAKEWGIEAYDMMQRIKQLLDPNGVFNPDVIISNDPDIHVKHIKPVPVIDSEINTCIECGFCEHVCPTKNYTLTPRQRIVLQREFSLVQPEVLHDVRADYEFSGLDTCVADSMCSVVCPVGIDTGAFVKRERSKRRSTWTRSMSMMLSRHYSIINILGKLSMRAAAIRVPTLRHPAPQLRPVGNNDAPFVLMAGCPSRWVGNAVERSSLEMLMDICRKSNIQVDIIQSNENMCCGQPFESNGFPEAAEISRTTLASAVGMKCLVIDTSTCSSCIAKTPEVPSSMSIVSFMHKNILPILQQNPSYKTNNMCVVHPGCSMAVLRETTMLVDILSCISDTVVVPDSAHCCGMAGDKGIRNPDLTIHALHDEVQEVQSYSEATLFVGVNPLCNANLSNRTNKLYIGLIEAVWNAMNTH